MNAIRPSLEERFWEHVDRGGQSDCWEWKGARLPAGYGQIHIKMEAGRQIMGRTHRVAWELHNGPISDGLQVLHRCDNPPCCNPHHLFLGTHADNMADMTRKGRAATGDHTPYSRRVRGEGHTLAKLTDEKVRAIRRLYLEGMNYEQLAAYFGVNSGTVWGVVKRRTWAHVE